MPAELPSQSDPSTGPLGSDCYVTYVIVSGHVQEVTMRLSPDQAVRIASMLRMSYEKNMACTLSWSHGPLISIQSGVGEISVGGKPSQTTSFIRRIREYIGF